MLENGTAWMLVADGRRARVLVEQSRGATLEERADLTMEISEDELYEPQDGRPRDSNRFGHGSHTVGNGRNLHEAEEEKFLKRVADRIGEADKRNQFEHLVIAAPPRALGLLRNLLPTSTQSRICATTPKDLLDEAAPKLRERLKDLLRN
ncbi:MAG: host attachment protein [Phycisphaerales bacterium]|nr:host attachment protein [Hyphomonadaceae bacterium]